jgi:2-oxoglutarate ferredoxin oxidoreductase subunit alpha
MTELPLVIIDVQRAGPSTGMPTKTEQSDLLMAVYGRNGEAPTPVVAARTPGDCYLAAYEACRIAVKHMTPVILLSDGYLGNGSEPWRIPDIADLPPFEVAFADDSAAKTEDGAFLPYVRDPDSLARPWARPGTAGLEHRIGGLEKDAQTGEVSYVPDNHQTMTRLRADKVARIANDFPPVELQGDTSGDVLFVGWGSTYGAIEAGAERARERGVRVGHIHLRWLNPLPHGLAEAMQRFDRVVVPELNDGQLVRLLRERFLVPAEGLDKVKGIPFTAREIEAAALTRDASTLP